MHGKSKLVAVLAAIGLVASAAAHADPVEDTLTVETDDGTIELVTKTAAPAFLKDTFDTIYSGWLFRETETRDLQKDDFDNPGMVFVDRGLDAWNETMGKNGESCAGCHEGPESMKGLRTVLPRVDAKTGKLMIMEDYINSCVTKEMGLEAWGVTSDKMKDMMALISVQSRGEVVNVAIDGPAQSFWEHGKEIYYTRYGQLEMSCANCHENNYGRMIRADHLSQGQVNGFPTYRLKDAGILSAQQRFVGCVRDTRAETFKAGSDEFKALELYVASRGNGLSIEGVSVRH
ncbi:MAG: sulfur oxidation c-type cytochrome SoxA [Alphaproteobacteria bacterium]|uniref:sulfur oxidation c-type cytochrome SoxA n=1 Tax=unclassified Rhizobium TaxID=2613769 RepID=UPI0006B9AB3E|nr:sulfur oxidation c-type cytochrome SoxA [Rhizobium sp. AAP116]KPF61079.1 sulfur oxidation c-type cytochrome SoxA [Rhizobium sp. AAP116]MBU0738418.1 sulfur oxidation c-type cytochrome SoxA [Alphaproteobacteria bacterium]MBU0831481.1 sulfur oxidation c-type cytochrome SoxA [Alphaproteobacteria bacterium]MBU1764374.1 sulfur oxidation c-type cytochrome SoxA [Alphaproteobacteria bacterium]